ncbi:hypothetical protein BDZ89DRAFT_1153835 [Hymenopellis radicata]|nr:hypothetical protein BDZ89DRAFT_1153835 [Hymenopellis radicata]
MFKRVDRRLKRKAEQEELGIDSELKEALGIPETDSDESESDDDSDDGDDGQDENQDDDANDEDDPADEQSSSDEADEDVDMTVKQVLVNPLHPSPSNPDITKCFICPGKLLKNETMIQLHLKSKHHIRRVSQFSKSCKKCEDHGSDARQYLPGRKELAPREGLSKREEKKLARRALQAKKRAERKAAYEARRAKRGSEPAASAKKDGKPSRSPRKKKIKTSGDGKSKSSGLSKKKAVADSNPRPKKKRKVEGKTE